MTVARETQRAIHDYGYDAIQYIGFVMLRNWLTGEKLDCKLAGLNQALAYAKDNAIRFRYGIAAMRRLTVRIRVAANAGIPEISSGQYQMALASRNNDGSEVFLVSPANASKLLAKYPDAVKREVETSQRWK